MYCPKCNQGFEEGSRRFCPTDGARLVTEASADNEELRKGGIFANLIPKMSGINDLGARLSEAPGVFVANPEKNADQDVGPGEASDDIFFELDDVVESEANTKLMVEPRDSQTATIQPPKPGDSPAPSVPRKVDLSTVPEGRIDIDTGYKGPDLHAAFDAERSEDLIGTLVKGRYKVTEFLGADETGLAYIADDRISEGKSVLVRVYVDGEIDQMLESILAEERISLSHFSHPNVARFVDSGEFVNGIPFIISEHVDGLSVADILSIHGRFDPKRASRIIRQISNALNEAHQEGILHRDIRPENIVLDPDAGDVEQAKLINFGASGGEANSDNLVYKSPEVIDGRINTIVSDIFSLGVVAFEMLTGVLPFEGESKNEILRSQYSGPSALPSVLRPELPSAVNEVLVKALGFKPAERFKKAREFGDALSSALAEATEEIKAEPQNIVDLKPLVSQPAKADPERSSAPRIQIPPVKRPEVASPAVAEVRSAPEPRAFTKEQSRSWYLAAAIAALLILGSALGWYYLSSDPGSVPSAGVAREGDVLAANPINPAPAGEANSTVGARTVVQPPNTEAFRNSKDNLTGDLASNFLGFSLYYPKDWKVIGPQPGTSSTARGKFLDISKSTPDGRLREQMLISFYPSSGTFEEDTTRFSQLVTETNATLEKILPGYQKVSEGPVLLDGGLRAYEVKFQGGGTSPTGDKLMVWGRRLFVPAGRPGARNGFEITMLATSHAENIRNADEVGVRGELGPILKSFEPSPN
jgi:serine/threonine protein kinase